MGRPVDGSFRVSDKALAALPAEGSTAQFAEVLGVTSATIRDWIIQENAPAEKIGEMYVLKRAPFIVWLSGCGRYKPTPVTDYAEQVKALSPEAQAFVNTWHNTVPQPTLFVAEFLNVLIAERKRF
jgi:hypothetical protein